MWRATPSVLTLCGLLGCSAAPEGVGLTGAPKYRDEDPVIANDMKSVSLRKKSLVTHHDVVAKEHCGGDCRYERRGVAELELAFEPNGVVRATNDGEQLEQFRSTAGDTTHHLAWSRRWEGSWTEGEGKFVLDLTPASTECQQRDADADEATDPCQAVPLKLVCVGSKVPLWRPKNERARAWVCSPDGHVLPGPGLTPFPWIFGIDTPVAMSDRALGSRTERFLLGELPAKGEKKSRPPG